MDAENKRNPAQGAYQAIKGDLIDEMLAGYVNQKGVQLPITRMGGGYYMFGTRRIYAKISNNKLIVRVGGGYTSIDEFINQYGETELQKIKLMHPEKLAELHTPTDKDRNRNNVVEMAAAKKWLANGGGAGSPRAGTASTMASRASPRRPTSGQHAD